MQLVIRICAQVVYCLTPIYKMWHSACLMWDQGANSLVKISLTMQHIAS